MEKEFNLSEKIHRQKFGVDVYIAMDDIKEFSDITKREEDVNGKAKNNKC